MWNNGRAHLQDQPLKPGTYRGPVTVRITGHRYTSAGVPEQTRTLPAGGTARFPVRVPLLRTAGDAPLSLQFASDTGTRTSLPQARGPGHREGHAHRHDPVLRPGGQGLPR